LTCPSTYGVGQWKDVVETINYIHSEYCRDINKKIFAIGFSLGGNWLALALGKTPELNSIISAASCIQPPIDVPRSFENIRKTWFGLVNWSLAQRYKAILKANIDYLAPVYQ